ncbi:hypothetical protein F5888DRAFT_1263481 [Russula emetica]|nr:hypothetical protein F5888DRAFT_1263481 [Russula emetica]
MQLLRNTQTGSSDLSHTIFQFFPTNTDTNRWLAACQYETVSLWALDLLLKQYETRKANVTADFYYDLSAMPEAATLRGHLFERQVLNHLCGIRTECAFPIRGLTDSDQEWTYRGYIGHFKFQESTVLHKITEAYQDQRLLHLVPLVRNSRSVD